MEPNSLIFQFFFLTRQYKICQVNSLCYIKFNIAKKI